MKRGPAFELDLLRDRSVAGAARNTPAATHSAGPSNPDIAPSTRRHADWWHVIRFTEPAASKPAGAANGRRVEEQGRSRAPVRARRARIKGCYMAPLRAAWTSSREQASRTNNAAASLSVQPIPALSAKAFAAIKAACRSSSLSAAP